MARICLISVKVLVIALFFAGVVNAALPTSSTETVQKQGDYVVKQGDTLYSIAWQFGLDYRVIAAMNHLSSPYQLAPGQSLLLVEQAHTAPPGLGNPPVIVKHLNTTNIKASTSTTHSTASNPRVVSTSVVATHSTTSLTWVWPTQGKIIKAYAIDSESNVNKGIDISGKVGQPIVAASSGEVVYSGNGIPGYGNLILIKHDADYLTAYAYNQKNEVKEGVKIKAGQQIALMGKGNNAKPDLHFEIRYQGKPVNPLNYLPKTPR